MFWIILSGLDAFRWSFSICTLNANAAHETRTTKSPYWAYFHAFSIWKDRTSNHPERYVFAFFFRASICKKLPASIGSKLFQRSNANTSGCILAHPYLLPLFRMENPAAYIHGVCAWFPRRCEGGWGGSQPKLAYPFPVQFLLNLQKSQDRIHSKFTVPISIHNGKTNLSVGLAVCIFCY